MADVACTNTPPCGFGGAEGAENSSHGSIQNISDIIITDRHMTTKPFWKRNVAKVLLFLVVFLVIAFLGGILFTCGLGFRMRTLLFRLFLMGVSVVWVVGCIWWICHRYRFGDIWRGMIDDLYAHQEDFERDLAKEYQALLSEFPMAVAQYEAACWKQRPRPTNVEIMDGALKISRQEWVEREKK